MTRNKQQFFKKGTIHLTFKDDKLWEKFNLEAARGKNWLPPASTNGKPKESDSKPKLVLELF
ncbi:MAG: DUF4942 domain-containing protein [Ignavibacteria bacterium]|nr:DUF4942 domain-containing protein [Ignavibacteria bacterium]